MTNKARCSLGNFRKSRALVLIVAFLAMFVDTVLTTVLRPIMPDYLYRLEHPNYTGAIITNKHIDNKPVTPCKGVATCLPIEPSQNLQRIKQLEKLSVKLGILYAAGPASSLITNPIAGWLADRFGYTFILYIGIVLIFASTIGFTFSTSYSALFVSQLVQGVGGSFSVIAAFIMLAMTFTDADRAKAIGVAQTGMTVGVLIGPVIGGVMYEFLGYKSPFLLIAGLAVVDGGKSGRLFEFKLIEGPIRSTSCSILIRWNGSICYGWGDGTGLDDDVYERFSVATRSFGITCGRRLYHWNFSLFHAGGKNRALAADFGWNPRIGSLYGNRLAETTVLTEIGELADTRHGSKYGSAFAISESAMCIGITIGLAVSGVLMDALGFFWMMLGLGLLNVLLSPAAILLRNVPSTEKMDKLTIVYKEENQLKTQFYKPQPGED